MKIQKQTNKENNWQNDNYPTKLEPNSPVSTNLGSISTRDTTPNSDIHTNTPDGGHYTIVGNTTPTHPRLNCNDSRSGIQITRAKIAPEVVQKALHYFMGRKSGGDAIQHFRFSSGFFQLPLTVMIGVANETFRRIEPAILKNSRSTNDVSATADKCLWGYVFFYQRYFF